MVFVAHGCAQKRPPVTPAEVGFRMPAEWEPHVATWLAWPRREGISFPGKYDKIIPIFSEMVHVISSSEDVHINVWDTDLKNDARDALSKHDALNDRVHFHYFKSLEPWIRDHGPIFVVNETERAIVNWEYNAWGGKYPPFDIENKIPGQIAKFRSLQQFKPTIILEGGAIEVNGNGTLLTTESCLLNQNRNPNLSKINIEKYLCDYLGVTNILWLSEGIKGDDTDGHIDVLARFVDANTIITVIEDNSDDDNFHPLQENLRRLKEMRDQDGKPFNIIEIPMPSPVIHEGERMPASYANFYITNNSVLVPTFRNSKDNSAIDTIQSRFPTRKAIGVDSTDLIWGLGSFHCLTQQEPLLK